MGGGWGGGGGGGRWVLILGGGDGMKPIRTHFLSGQPMGLRSGRVAQCAIEINTLSVMGLLWAPSTKGRYR